MAEELTCSICYDVIRSCVTLVPCLHNFCSGCISSWLASCRCPLCNSAIIEAKKNNILNKVLELQQETNLEPIIEDGTDFFANAMAVKCFDFRICTSTNTELQRVIGKVDRCPLCTHQIKNHFDDICCALYPHLKCSLCSRMFPTPDRLSLVTCAICKNSYCSEVLMSCFLPNELKLVSDYYSSDLSLKLEDFRSHKPEFSVDLTVIGASPLYETKESGGKTYMDVYRVNFLTQARGIQLYP